MAALFKRRGVRIVTVGLVLLVILMVAVRFLVPADKVRDLLVTQIKEQTGIDVSFGEAKVSVFPRVKVVVADGEFAGTGADLIGEDTGSDQVASQPPSSPIESFQGSLEHLEVDLALWPLLRKRIEMGQIRLIRPNLVINTRPASDSEARASASGRDAPKSPAREPSSSGQQGQPVPAEPGSAAPPAALPWELAIAGIEFRQGNLLWREVGSAKQVAISGWDQKVTAPQMALLIERLNAFSYGTPPPQDSATAELDLDSKVQKIAVTGFGEGPPLELEDISLRGRLMVPPAVDKLQVGISELAWRQVHLTADLELTPPGPTGSRLQGSWHCEPLALPSLLADLQELAPPAEGEMAVWLQEDPVQSGQVAVTGQVDLPWPMPEKLVPRDLWTALPVSGDITSVQMALPRQLGQLSGNVAFTVDGDGWRVEQIQLQAGDDAMKLQGKLAGSWDGAPGRLQADLKSDADLAFLTTTLNSLRSEAEGSAPLITYQPVGKVQAQITVDMPDPPDFGNTQRWQEMLSGGQLQGVRIAGQGTDLSLTNFTPGEPWRAAEISFTSDLSTATFALTGVEHPHLHGSLTGRATRLFPVPVLEVDLAVTQIDVDRLVALWQSETSTALLSPGRTLLDRLVQEWVGIAWALTPPRADARPLGEILPQDLVIAYQGKAERLILQKAGYDRVELQGNLVDKVAWIDTLTAHRGGGLIQGNGSIDYTSDPHGQFNFAAHATDVSAGALLEPYVPGVAALWEGAVTAQVNGGCSLKDKATVLSTLSLLGGARSTNGHIDARSLLEDISPYLGSRQDLKVVRFREFLQDIDVNQGRYHLNSLLLTGPDTDWQGNGWLGFDGSLDLNLHVKLPAGFTPKLGDLSFLAENMRGDDGRIQLGFRLSGQATSPVVQLDLTQAKEAAQDQVEETVQDRVQGLLDKWKRK